MGNARPGEPPWPAKSRATQPRLTAVMAGRSIHVGHCVPGRVWRTPRPLAMVEPDAIPARRAQPLSASGRQPDNPSHATGQTMARPVNVLKPVTL